MQFIDLAIVLDIDVRIEKNRECLRDYMEFRFKKGNFNYSTKVPMEDLIGFNGPWATLENMICNEVLNHFGIKEEYNEQKEGEGNPFPKSTTNTGSF